MWSQRLERKFAKVEFREDQEENKMTSPEMSIQLLFLGLIWGEEKVILKNKTLNCSDYEQHFLQHPR